MTDDGHAAVELALAVGALLLPVALVVMSFGPWLQRRVAAEAAAAEAARTAVLELDMVAGASAALQVAEAHGVVPELVRLAWCGGEPSSIGSPGGVCAFDRGSVVEVTVEMWAPAVATPWGPVGGVWVTSGHAEPVDLYRSLP